MLAITQMPQPIRGASVIISPLDGDKLSASQPSILHHVPSPTRVVLAAVIRRQPLFSWPSSISWIGNRSLATIAVLVSTTAASTRRRGSHVTHTAFEPISVQRGDTQIFCHSFTDHIAFRVNQMHSGQAEVKVFSAELAMGSAEDFEGIPRTSQIC
jgi:hypothetical protein